jgi:hypothetical protein
MTLVSPSQSNPGDEIRAASINDPVNDLADVINGNIDDTNIASVSGSKIANGTVTNAKLSTAAGEPGGAWQTWTPTYTGFSAAPTGGTYRYKVVGKTVHVAVKTPNNGTSNSTSFTMTLPLTCANIPGMEWQCTLNNLVNNGSVVGPGFGYLGPNTNIIFFSINSAGAGWTASGGKRINGMYLVYETD